MNPLFTTARFELLYQLRQPTFYLYAILLIGQGIWYSSQLTALYPYDNAAVTAYLVLSSLGVMLAVIATLLAGQSLTKDLDYRTMHLLFVLPITPRMHFAGRFLGTYATVMLLAVCYSIGIWVYDSFYGINSVDVWIALLDGFIRLVAQNIFIAVSLTFSLTVLLRSIRGAYIVLFLVVLYFLLTEINQEFAVKADIWQLLDPFGVDMARESAETMALVDEPSDILAFSDMFFINRILWLGLASGLLAYAENRFTFSYFTEVKSTKTHPAKPDSRKTQQLSNSIHVRLYFGGWNTWRTMIQLTKQEFVNLVRQPTFLITIGLLILLSVLLITVLNLNPNFPELPTTSRMTALRLPMGFFIGLFLLVMTTELIFLERTVGFWAIHHALPQPSFVFLLAKLLALIGVAALLTLVLFLTGIGVQISSGFYQIDWQLYTSDLFTDGFLRYCQLIALGALVAALVNNRIVSHVVNLIAFALLTFTYQLTDDQVIYLYSFLPDSAHYSDLTGYGPSNSLRSLVRLVWWSVAGIFVVSYLLIWNRGVLSPLIDRIRQWRAQFSRPYQLAFLALCMLLSLSVWQTIQWQKGVSFSPPIQYSSQTSTIPSISGKDITIQVHYYHPYQVRQMLRIAAQALHKGETLFGAYPYAGLHITETPSGILDLGSKPGQILLPETQGWIADYRKPSQLDYIDYLVSREVFKQWLVHKLNPKQQPGDGFIKQSLAEYLALQNTGQQYGSERLKQRLAQRAKWYAKSRLFRHKQVVSVLQSSGDDALERGRALLALTSIEQIWGDKPLSLTISQFYKQATEQPTSATASAFATTLGHQLPESLKYLQTYLSHQYEFDFKIGHVANLSNGLTIEVLTTKWETLPNGQKQKIPINDYVPLVVLDKNGHQLHRELIHPNPDERFISLPAFPTAHQVIVDPLGAWPEPNKQDNCKLL
ncbi:hypothetical protein GCM10028805_21910 [Spirosoma harenae]